MKEENKTLRAAAADVSASPDVTVVDYDGEYTAAEIAKMRAEKQKEIRDLDLKLLFCNTAKKYNILIVPGSSFGCPGYVRMAYCVAYETIVNALPKFAELAREYR